MDDIFNGSYLFNRCQEYRTPLRAGATGILLRSLAGSVSTRSVTLYGGGNRRLLTHVDGPSLYRPSTRVSFVIRLS